MKTLHRYLASEILGSTVFVFTALLMLFAFFDLINELGDLGKANYRLHVVLVYVLLSVPGHIYELFPVAALIGTMFALGRFVATSEFTVMRTSGLSFLRIARSVMRIGLIFVVLTYVFGEFVAPWSERTAQNLRLKSMNANITQEFRSGVWVRDERSFVNIREILPDSTMSGIKIYEFDDQYRLTDISFAERGEYLEGNRWRLHNVEQTHFEDRHASVRHIPEAYWHSVLNPNLIGVLLIVPEQMSAWSLYTYIQHLRENRQSTARYEIAFWSKVSYPFAALVMMLLALPFASQQARMAGVSGKVFAGIMLGLGFHLLNRLFSHLGLLNGWPPAFSATFPALLFLVAALYMMWRIERR